MLAAAVVVSSCGGGGSKEESSDASSEFDAAKEQVAADVSKVLKDLPPPSEVPYLLMNAGAEFDPNIINSIDKMESYQASESKAALNLGVYATDIGYLASYEKAEMALHEHLKDIEPTYRESLSSRHYGVAFDILASLRPFLSELFNTVKILDDDPAIQQNRIALLQQVFTLFTPLLDFSKIQQEKP